MKIAGHKAMALIHPTAVIESGAKIEADVTIGAYTVIGPHVQIGAGSQVGPHVLIEGDTILGRNNKVGPFTSLGVKPQDLKYKGEFTRLRIGNGNTFREYVNVSTGSVDGKLETVIGNDNFIMCYSHIGHDCCIGNNTILANCATLAGHVDIGDYVVTGGIVAIHQFTRIGAHAMLGGGSMVVQDIAPFVLAFGNRAEPLGINAKGLSRRGFSNEKIAAIKNAYRLVYRNKLPLDDALAKIETDLVPACPELCIFTEFLKNTRRGVAR
jgi:UDP-N-acetylglucosamine acyltransferase